MRRKNFSGWQDLIIINKKERTCRIADFAVSTDHWVNSKESEKKDKYLYRARELKKLWNMKVTVIPIVTDAFGTVTKGLIGTGKKGLGNKRTSGDHRNYRIIKIGQNLEKSLEDLLRGTLNRFPVFYRMGTFIDSAHMKL